MNKMSDEEIIEVVKAHRNGKQIQYYTDYGWLNADCPSWDFESKEYRIKPEVGKPRPFKDLEEFAFAWKRINDVERTKVNRLSVGGIWLTALDSDIQYLVTAVDWNNNKLCVLDCWINLERLSREFKFSDGSPCGVQ